VGLVGPYLSSVHLRQSHHVAKVYRYRNAQCRQSTGSTHQEVTYSYLSVNLFVIWKELCLVIAYRALEEESWELHPSASLCVKVCISCPHIDRVVAIKMHGALQMVDESIEGGPNHDSQWTLPIYQRNYAFS
jgi:hypothetical protein